MKPQNATFHTYKIKMKQEKKETGTGNQAGKRGKIAGILITLVTLFMLVITPIISAMPEINLVNITNPLEYGQTQKITLSITANSTVEQALIEFGQQNHTLQKEASYYTYSWLPEQKGSNNYVIYAIDSQNDTQKHSGSFAVQDTTPPEILETQPSGSLNYNLVELSALTNENSTCKYDQVDVSYDSMYFALSGEGASHTKLRNFGDGQYIIYVLCKDTANNIGQSQTISFTIDTTPPAISEITPSGTVSQAENTLKINTDEMATCKWSTTSQEYNSLENYFQLTNNIRHEQPLTLKEGANTYYVSCKDKSDNKNPSLILNIDLNLLPTASISVEQNSSYDIIRQGTYKIKLTASEALPQAPILQLKYTNKLINVPLEGSSQTWTGYLIIPSDQIEEVGEFVFIGKDTKGTIGTEITSGKLILIDNTPPNLPTTLNLLNEKNAIKISWDYAGDEPDHYNIYRSTTGKTDKSNLKYASPGKTYLDTDVLNQIGYFYRVSAVDKAGNEGLLTEEEFLMVEFQNATSHFKQDPVLLELINDKISELEKISQDLDVKTSALEGKTDASILELLNEEKIIDGQKEVRSKILQLIGELKTYRETIMTKDDLTAKITIIDGKVAGYKQEIIQDIVIQNKVQNEQVIDEGLLQEIAKAYLTGKGSAEMLSEYLRVTKELQKKTRVLQDITSFEVKYEYKESEKIMIIKESILTTEDLTGVLAQEAIPKDVVKVSEITFVDTPAEINEQGVIWNLKSLKESKTSYKISTEKDMARLQRIKTVLLYDQDEFLSALSKQNQTIPEITGNVVSDSGQSNGLTQKILILIGVVLVIALLSYYFISLRTEGAYEKKTLGGQLSHQGQAINTLNTLVQEAYQNLEKGELGLAKQNYTDALLIYNGSKLGLRERMRANLEMNSLSEAIRKL